MPITHAFISARPDTTDSTKVRASNWNANHVIDIFVDNETPEGILDGANDTFTLASTPSPAASLQLFRNSNLQVKDTSYTLIGSTIVFASGYIPQTDDILRAWYRKA